MPNVLVIAAIDSLVAGYNSIPHAFPRNQHSRSDPCKMWRWTLLLVAACGVDAFVSIGGGLGGRAPALGAAQRGERSPFPLRHTGEHLQRRQSFIIKVGTGTGIFQRSIHAYCTRIHRFLRPPCAQALSSRAAEAREGFRPWPCKIRPGPRCLRSTHLRVRFLSRVLSVSISVGIYVCIKVCVCVCVCVFVCVAC